MSTFQRARRPEHKQSRRDAMLTGAADLAAARSVREVTLTDIAERAGVHKSGVLRYFASREAVFLELVASEWAEWAKELPTAVPGADVGRLLAETLTARPLFCDLLAQAPLNLERGAPVEVVVEVKARVLAAVDRAARTLEARYAALSAEQARDLVGASTALAGALWNIANPPPALRAAYEREPALAGACVDLLPVLDRLTRALATGLTEA